MRLQLYPVTEVPYVHGYSAREADRLADQANTLSELLHHDTLYPPGSLVLECGCGTGAQTVHLAARNPGARIVAVDISAASLVEAGDVLIVDSGSTTEWLARSIPGVAARR